MKNVVDFVKQNWISSALLLVIIFLIGRTGGGGTYTARSVSNGMMEGFSGVNNVGISKGFGGIVADNNQSIAPISGGARMMIQDTSISMQVKDVSSVMGEIEKIVSGLGGYMVNRSMVKPEGAASGNITIRVPTEKREDTLISIKKLGIKTVSENVSGNDVTDQYVDIQGRINSLNKTKAKMELLLDQSGNVSDLMNIQLQINNIQSQIDNYVGQQKYLEQTAKLTRITINLSTDELALPYTPDAAWRPTVVFKTAVRSMIGALRSLASFVIWMVVYVPVLAILGLIYWLVNKAWIKYQVK